MLILIKRGYIIVTAQPFKDWVSLSSIFKIKDNAQIFHILPHASMNHGLIFPSLMNSLFKAITLQTFFALYIIYNLRALTEALSYPLFFEE